MGPHTIKAGEQIPDSWYDAQLNRYLEEREEQEQETEENEPPD